MLFIARSYRPMMFSALYICSFEKQRVARAIVFAMLQWSCTDDFNNMTISDACRYMSKAGRHVMTAPIAQDHLILTCHSTNWDTLTLSRVYANKCDKAARNRLHGVMVEGDNITPASSAHRDITECLCSFISVHIQTT